MKKVIDTFDSEKTGRNLKVKGIDVVPFLGPLMPDTMDQKNLALREKVVAKLPDTPNGLCVIKLLKDEGIDTLATAIYSVQHTLMAANCGAAYVAPYVNRICDLEIDGVGATLMEKIICNQNAVSASVDFIEAWEKYIGKDELTLG